MLRLEEALVVDRRRRDVVVADELRRAEEERARYEAEMAEYRRLYGDDQ